MKKFKNELVYIKESEKITKIEDLPYLFVTEFTDTSVIEFYKKFIEMQNNDKVKSIPVVISSYGGQVHSLLSMLDIIADSNKPVATIGLGKAMSCGAVLLAAGTKGYRYAAPSTDIMIHEVSSMDWGKTTDLKNSTKHTGEMNDSLFRFLAKQSGKTDKDFFLKELKKQGNVDWYLSSLDYKKLGLIDFTTLPKLVRE